MKVVEVLDGKDKKGKRSIEYLIHFQGRSFLSAYFKPRGGIKQKFSFFKKINKGWNSSWDRSVQEDFVLKDTEKNRQLQKDLAEKSQLQM